MENKSITLESSINFKTKEEYEQYRKRENARAFVEEMRRKRAQRILLETTVGTYHRTPRPYMPDSWREGFFRRDKNDKTETKKDSTRNP